MEGFKKLTPLDEALRVASSALSISLKEEKVPAYEAAGRYAAEDVISPSNVPDRDRAAFDGYAVRSADTLNATRQKPARLKIVKGGAISPGEAVEICTGNPLPRGSDAVVMYERCSVSGNHLFVYEPLPKWANVCRKGEVLREGALIASKGSRISPYAMGLVVLSGLKEVPVFEKLKIGVFSVGSEVGREIPDSNRPMLVEICRRYGFSPVDGGIVPDDPREVSRKFVELSRECHLVLSIGGTSAGKDDPVLDSLKSLGEVIVRGVSIRPGRPLTVASYGGKPLIALPGFPVSCVSAFYLFVRPLIESLAGIKIPRRRAVAELSSPVAGRVGYSCFVRVKLSRSGGKLFASPIEVSGASALQTLAFADGFFVTSPDVEYLPKGTRVEVELLA